MKSKVILLGLGFIFLQLLIVGCGQVVKQQESSNGSSLINSIKVSPNNISIPIGSTQQFYISNIDITNAGGSSELLWEVIGDVGTISSTGLFTATKTGTGQIRATYNGKSDIAQIVVVSTPGTKMPTTPTSPSEELPIPLAPHTPPAVPTGFVGTGGDGVVYLHWNLNSESYLAGYVIYRGSPGEAAIEIARTSNITNYEDRTAHNGEGYYYHIKAVDEYGNYSYDSPDIYVIPRTNYGLPPIPQNLAISLEGYSIRVKWDPIISPNVIGYKVYRRMNDDVSYGRLNALPITSSEYIDTSISSNNAYYYVVTSVNPSNDESPYSSEVNIYYDKTPPSLSATTNVNKFSPNGDGRYDGIELDMQSNERVGMNIQILGNDGELLYSALMMANPNETIKFSWLNNEYRYYRKDSMGNWQIEAIAPAATAADGNYIFRIQATDGAGNKSRVVDCAFEKDTVPPNITNIQDAPDYFSPDGDGLDETSTISCDLSEIAYVSVKIYDSENNLFRTLGGISGTNSYSCGWDGRSSAGAYKPDYYTFTYEIGAQDSVGNSAQSPRSEISTNRSPSRVSYAYGAPDPFNPRSGGYSDIHYFLSFNSNVTVTIDGVKMLLSNVPQARGEYNIRWHGDYDSSYAGSKDAVDNSKVGSGSYLFRISAYDPRGGSPANVTNTIRVDNR